MNINQLISIVKSKIEGKLKSTFKIEKWKKCPHSTEAPDFPAEV